MKGIPKIDDPATWPLPVLMGRIEAAGWCFHFSSRLVDGARLYKAVVWREDQSAFSKKSRDPDAAHALAGAWRMAQNRERRAPQQRRRRLKQLGLSPEVSQ